MRSTLVSFGKISKPIWKFAGPWPLVRGRNPQKRVGILFERYYNCFSGGMCMATMSGFTYARLEKQLADLARTLCARHPVALLARRLSHGITLPRMVVGAWLLHLRARVLRGAYADMQDLQLS